MVPTIQARDGRNLFLTSGVAIGADGGRLFVEYGGNRLPLPSVCPAAVARIAALNHGRLAATEVFGQNGRAEERAQVANVAQVLLENGFVKVGLFAGDEPLAVLHPTSRFFVLSDGQAEASCKYGLSRFCYLHQEGHRWVLRSPTSHCCLEFFRTDLLGVILRLVELATPEELAVALGEDALSLLSLLISGGFTSACDGAGSVVVDAPVALRQWEFHDLLFHARSRSGRHSEPRGGTYRFLGSIPPLPATKPPMASEGPSLPLPRPDIGRLLRDDVTLTWALENRASVREDRLAPTLAEIGEFLYRTSRVKGRSIYQTMELTSRPYPSGGASYSLEIYLAVDRCEGLNTGLYHYDPGDHTLRHCPAPATYVECLHRDAWASSAYNARPGVLIIIASRFQRVSWKYTSIAYATILKDVGVLLQTMYLVATAMGMAPCALGSGDSDLFARAINEDYYVETSVGEFMLGGRRQG